MNAQATKIGCKYLAIILASYILIAWDNPLTHRYLVVKMPSLFLINTDNPSITERLNNTVFKTAGEPVSHDFSSPFDSITPQFIVALFLGVAGLVNVVIKRRFSYILCAIACVFGGLGYVRLIPYMAIVGTICLFRND